MEEFLEGSEKEVREVLQRHRELISRKWNSAAHTDLSRPLRRWADFLEAAWLNPNTELFHVRPVPVLERHRESGHRVCRSGPPGPAYEPLETGAQIRIGEVLSVYSDEPDWGMDQGLAAIPEYGYGDLPLGRVSGPSSQAHFHMCFIADGPVGRLLGKRFKKSFMYERISLFTALARIALSKGALYWGWRFAAWALHYIQDLTQPYHARLFPPGIGVVARRFFADPNPFGFTSRHSNILTNRHHLVEAAAHYLLNEHFKTGWEGSWQRALKNGALNGPESLESLMAEAANFAAPLAAGLDRNTIGMINDPRITQPDFHFEDHGDYPIAHLVERARIERNGSFIFFEESMASCLRVTGACTRSLIYGLLAQVSQSSS
jgi:hypothetical protein